MDKKLLIIGLITVVALIAACTENTHLPPGPDKVVLAGDNTSSGSQELKKFSSKEELMDYIESSQRYNSAGSFSLGRDSAAAEGAAADYAPSAAPMAQKSVSTGGSASDYSQTNVQVEGVDEADFIKNDGKYIYTISGNKLVIVDAYPADSAKIVSKTEVNGTPTELFVDDDMLVVFTQGYDYVNAYSEYDYMPRPVYKQLTHAIVFDISDRKNPRAVRNYDIKGNYYTSRMIGDYVYLVVQDYVYYYNRLLDVPVVRESSKVVMTPDIYYFDNPDTSYNFNTVMSFNLKEDSDPEAKTFMMGYTGSIYVSEENMYITYQKSYPYAYYDSESEKRFFDVVVPLLPSDVKSEINDIEDDDSLSRAEKWDRISAKLEETYNRMDETEKEQLISDIEDGIEEYNVKREEELRRTVIHRIAIKDGRIDYEARGEVKGYLLNQFSMDENNNRFRVATTMESYINGDYVQYNNVYVLDMDLDTVGKLEEIAPDERIYSTRFLGDRLYMVTFQRMDPFFVIDMSGNDPKVLGKLKIPGFSDYLHPYDETHIIGVGKETGENEYGQVSVKGVKIALFDVSDVENPKQVDKYDIGVQGTDSEALYEHKAFLFDKAKSLLVIPVREVKAKRVYDSRYGYYTQKTWQGAYVFTVTEDGIELKGKISHSEDDEPEYWYYGAPSAVRRSLFMDDVLYTVSQKKIMANDLDSLEEIKSVELPYEQSGYYYPYPMPVRGGMVIE